MYRLKITLQNGEEHNILSNFDYTLKMIAISLVENLAKYYSAELFDLHGRLCGKVDQSTNLEWKAFR